MTPRTSGRFAVPADIESACGDPRAQLEDVSGWNRHGLYFKIMFCSVCVQSPSKTKALFKSGAFQQFKAVDSYQSKINSGVLLSAVMPREEAVNIKSMKQKRLKCKMHFFTNLLLQRPKHQRNLDMMNKSLLKMNLKMGNHERSPHP